ncbi:DASH family cryptochrome [Thalassotalea mangrovi]|uniref:Cryptochrome DASH n=1 Tax=Thalassotalea mangrovi TaxID=2572245 RepID=A0A4U1B9N0_9GAMM|nr:DASH family cryptochrome [Thalassotalea mangrovi]TKB47487.1 DASH family cryptochrome [Thalassotalea mangrovi]
MTTTLYWFTHDLRLADNRLLQQSLAKSQKIAFVYIVDPTWFKPSNYHHMSMGPKRWQFIADSLQDLNRQLRALGHRLTIIKGRPGSVIDSLFSALEFDWLAVAQQVGVYEQQQLKSIQQLVPKIQLLSDWLHTLYSPYQLESLNARDVNTLQSFSRFRRKVEKLPLSPIEVCNAPLTSVDDMDICNADIDGIVIEPDSDLSERWYSGEPQERQNRAAATLKTQVTVMKGGENAAIKHLHDYFKSGSASTYKETRNALDGEYNTTGFSPYLASGNVSPRQVYQHLKSYENQFGENESTYWIYFELLWREYFQWLALSIGPRLFSFRGLAKQAPLTTFFPERFSKWCRGNTPFPIVNACMRQLNATGLMSNRGRQLVASCLVNELGLDWRYGAAYFQQQLIDYDVASNWGNWQYIAGVGVDPRGGRHFNLLKQTQLFDPNSEFIEKWQGQGDDVPLDSADISDWPVNPETEDAKN